MLHSGEMVGDQGATGGWASDVQGLGCRAGLEPGVGLGGGLRPQVGAGCAVLGEVWRRGCWKQALSPQAGNLVTCHQ